MSKLFNFTEEARNELVRLNSGNKIPGYVVLKNGTRIGQGAQPVLIGRDSRHSGIPTDWE